MRKGYDYRMFTRMFVGTLFSRYSFPSHLLHTWEIGNIPSYGLLRCEGFTYANVYSTGQASESMIIILEYLTGDLTNPVHLILFEMLFN
jgi:hypothetical protein